MKKVHKKAGKTGGKPSPTLNQIQSIVRGSMLSLQTGSVPSDRPPVEFRPSSFPFCPLVFASADLSEEANSEIYTENFYFEGGTMLHELIQKFLPLGLSGANVFGNWECSSCGRSKKLCLRPSKCKKCKGTKTQRWVYKEIEVVYGDLVGHVDMVLQIPCSPDTPAKDRKFILCDYKSTNLPDEKKKPKIGGKNGWAPSFKSDKYPIPPNVVQISVYNTILRDTLKLNVIGWALIYTDRSRPVRSPKDFIICPYEWTKADHKLWKARLDAALKASVPAKKALAIRQKGKKPDKALIGKIVSNRPCSTKKEYEDYMKAGFHYDGDCKHLDMCTSGCTSSKLVKYFSEQMET